MAQPRFLPPEPLGPIHELARFDNGRHAVLDGWLKTRARASEGLSARTYVVCAPAAEARVVGYYALATAVVHRIGLPTARLRRGMPEEVPMLLLARLAVDQTVHGQGLGAALLADALRRCAAVAALAGVRGVLAHAIDDEAVAFYLRHGFQAATALGERAVFLPIENLRQAIGPGAA